MAYSVKFVLLALAVMISSPAFAKRPAGSFGAILMPSKEPTPAMSKASGLVDVLYKEDATTFKVTASVSNIEDTYMAHIHLGNSTTEGPVVLWIFPVTQAPLSPPISGSFKFSYTFNVTDLAFPASLGLNATDAYAVGDKFTSLLKTKGLYVNFHTTKYPGGEIRGQLHN